MTTLANPVLTEKPRISSIDLMRGIVMIIMALDHTRDFFHADANVFDPTDLAKTSPVLFFTRWITHFCAVTFVLLSGVAARISRQRKTQKELFVFLFTRGLWLIVLEFTVIRFGLLFNLYYDFSILQVIWVLGASMIVLSALIFLPETVIGIIGLVLIFTHNAFDHRLLQAGDTAYVPWAVLNQGGFIQISEGHFIIAGYPLIPWLGVMLIGYAVGTWYTKEFNGQARRKRLLIAGVIAMVLFVVLRGINIYGDPRPWTEQKNALYTVMSFLNCNKYPVSLLFKLMILGPVFTMLSFLDNKDIYSLKPRGAFGRGWLIRYVLNFFARCAVVFGRVPLFYYILHFYMLHAVSLVLYMSISGKSLGQVNFHFGNNFGGIPNGFGYSLEWVYVVWISLIVLLYPICKWYNRYKSTHDYAWLSYL
jgi:uncharacterized membrane protein